MLAMKQTSLFLMLTSILKSHCADSYSDLIDTKISLVTKFVCELVDDTIVFDHLRVHDTMLIKIGHEPESDLFNEISKKILPSRIVITIDSIESAGLTILQPVSIIICIVDASNGVVY